ncbi:MAG: LCP family protein [Coriobacteriia bacterium]|nr:LCP family protein [Coriobacteriia bacterium]
MARYEQKKSNRRGAHQADASASSRSSYGSGETSTYRDHRAGARDAVPGAASNPYSRAGHNSHNYVRNNKLAKKRSRRRKGIIAGAVLLVALLLGGAGAAFAYMSYLDGQMNGLDADATASLQATDNASDPFYMLLIGVDKSEARESSGKWGGYRTDSMILTRVDPQNKHITMISIARDLKTDMGEHGTQKINAAYTFGGPAGAIKTISELAGVPISHYAEIDFDAFKEVVDALGGIEVTVPVDIDDKHVDDKIKAGKQTLNGSQTLSLCRSRHTYDKLGDGDALRTANQRMVLSAIMKKVLSSDLPTMMNTVNTMVGYVTTDMSASYILGLAQQFNGIDVDKNVYTASTPKTSERQNGVWWDILLEDQWRTMMSRVDQGLSPTEETQTDSATGIETSHSGNGGTASTSSTQGSTSTDLSGLSIVVKNGCGVSGCADQAAAKLKAQGASCDTGNADNFAYTSTLVIYDDDSQKDKADEVAETLGLGQVKKNNGTYSHKGDILVVLGADWK